MSSHIHTHHPVVDICQQRRHRERKHAVPEPVGARRQADRLGADLAGEDLGRVRPGHGAPGHGEGRDEQVGARDDGAGHGPVPGDDPRHGRAGGVDRLAVVLLQAAGDEEPGAHEEGADDERGSPAEPVEVEDGGERHRYVDDVLDRRREKLGEGGG